MSPTFKQVKLDFALLDFYDTYVVCKINQGGLLNTPEIINLHKIYKAHFNGKKYGYIFDRTTDYTVDPMGYMKCPYYADVRAFAVVAPNPCTKQTVLFEQKFSERELKLFDTLEDAMKWMEMFNSRKSA